jgi:SAM-dependent methyltransferase
MRPQVRAFVEIAVRTFELRGPVYEFGSYQVAGQEHLSDLRGLFPGQKYIGCDARPGPGVDRVEDATRISLPDGCAQTVVCVDTLEHVFDVPRAVHEMIRLLRPGGALLISAPMDFRIHEYPSDYWRLTPACVARLLHPLAACVVGSQGVETHPHTVLGIGFCAPVPLTFARRAELFIAQFQGWLHAARGRLPRRKRWKNRLAQWLGTKGERRRRQCEFESRFVVHVREPATPRPLDVHSSAAACKGDLAAPRRHAPAA